MTPSFLRTLIVSLLLGVVAAFVVPQTPTVASSGKTVMHFKFLKELGLEKPSWLPDFGGKKEEEAAPAPVAAAEEEGEGEEVAAAAKEE